MSDAERDQAVSELSEHFQAGRLTLEEFEERSGRALTAKTGRELKALFGDLPRNGAPAPAPAAAQQPALARGGARLLLGFPIGLFIAIAALASTSDHHRMFGALVPIAFVCLVCMRVAARRGISRT